DDDDDEESSNSLEDNIIFEIPSYSAVIPSEPVDSLSMGDEHLDTISATESDEFINDDQSLSDEDVPEKIYSNPLFDEEINPMEIDKHSCNAESDVIGSMPNHDSSIIISSKIDSLFDEFADELTLLESIPPGIDETGCHPEKEIRIEDDDYDSGRDILILEELLDNYSLSIPANEAYHFDIPSPYRPPAKPPDGNTGSLNIKMMGDVSDQK
nr:hypothetical protein [Tanacetum cinerariifolium]